MAIEFAETYPVPPTDIYAIFTDMAFYEARYQRSGVDEYDVRTFEVKDDGFDIVVEINPKIEFAEKVPRAAKRLIPDRQRIVYSGHWNLLADDSIEANYLYDVQDRPIRIRGHRIMRPIDGGEGTDNKVTFKVECEVPVFGNILARILQDRVRTELDADEKSIREFLAAKQTV